MQGGEEKIFRKMDRISGVIGKAGLDPCQMAVGPKRRSGRRSAVGGRALGGSTSGNMTAGGSTSWAAMDLLQGLASQSRTLLLMDSEKKQAHCILSSK